MVRRPAQHSRRQYVLQSRALEIARDLPGTRSAPFPKFIEPALATLHPRPPKGDKWVHEIKFDGYRAQLHKREGTRVYTRRGYDWTDRFRNIAAAAGELVADAVILDGEVIVPTPEGRSDFSALESALARKGGSDDLVFYAFDIPYLEVFD